MAGNIEKTLFLSYRRKDAGWAQAIFGDLTSHGFDVFFDYQSIPSGDFEKIIVENVKKRAHFLVILTPSALERCHEPDDWLRREIETALVARRNIVPLMLENFDFRSETTIKSLTGKLNILQKYNGLSIENRHFSETMAKLREQFLKVPLEAVSHPVDISSDEYRENRKLVESEVLRVKRSQASTKEWVENIKRGVYRDVDGKNEEKIHHYTEMIQSSPHSPKAYCYRASARHDVGDLDGAIQDYDQALWLIKTYGNNQYNNSNERFGFDNWPQEDEEAGTFIHDCVVAYSKRAMDRYEQGDYDDAIADYNQIVRLEPDFHGAYFWRGVCYQNKGMIDKAISDYTKSVDFDPDEFRAFYQRGAIQYVNGKFNAAIADFTKTILIKPDQAMARVSLINLLRKLGKVEEAKDHEQIALILIQKENEYTRACFEAVRGRPDKALDLLEIWFAKSPGHKKWATQDPDLENLRDHLRFKELVGE